MRKISLLLIFLLVPLLWAVPAHAYKFKQSSFTGNSTTQSITGVGFQPEFVVVQCGALSMWTCAALGANVTLFWSSSGASVATCITSLDSDGFSVGQGSSGRCNTNLATCHYVAVASDAKNDFSQQTYTTGASPVDNRALTTSPSFQPALAIIRCKGCTTTVSVFHTTAMGNATDTPASTTTSVNAANIIQQLTSTGVEVGTATSVQTANETFALVTFKSVANSMATGLFSGDGLDNKNVTLSSAGTPAWILLKGTSATAKTCQRYGTETGDNAFEENVGEGADRIQSLGLNTMQVGIDTCANETGTNNMQWFSVRTPVYSAPGAAMFLN